MMVIVIVLMIVRVIMGTGMAMRMAVAVRVTMSMLVTMVMAAGQQPGAGDVDQKPERGDRDRLVEGDRNRIEEAKHRLIADQKGDHREHDRTGIAGEIAELAGPEGEVGI